MADKKISALTGAATPLAGTEVLPIVQSGSTVKVAVSDLTAGRNVAVGATVGVPRTLSVGGSVALERYNATPTIALRGGTDNTVGYEYRYNIVQTNGLSISTATIGGSQTEYWFFEPDGDFRVANSNLVIGTAAKGIDFSANTHAAGMTSEVLDWYEEGTFTPSFNQGFTAPVSYTTQTGKYTRIGDMVYFHAYIYMDAGQTRAAVALALAGLPFPVASGAYISLVWNYAAGVVAAGTALPTIYSGGVFYNTGGSAFLGTALTSARPEVAISGFYKTT